MSPKLEGDMQTHKLPSKIAIDTEHQNTTPTYNSTSQGSIFITGNSLSSLSRVVSALVPSIQHLQVILRF
jgi:hypothetical protein